MGALFCSVSPCFLMYGIMGDFLDDSGEVTVKLLSVETVDSLLEVTG